MSVYKKLTPSDVSITPFNTHKQYTYNSSSAGQNGVTFYSGQYSSQSIDFYEKYDVLGSKKYFQADQLYYNNFKLDIANMFGDISYRKSQRTLYDKANILSIPSALYGYQIKPTTFYLSGSFAANQAVSRSAIVTDDGKGNLVSNDFTTGTAYFRDVVKRLMYIGPDNAFKQYNLDIYNHDNRNRPRHIGEKIVNAPTNYDTPDKEYVYDDSYYFNHLTYKDVTFSPMTLTGSYNYPGIDFNGSTSYIQSPHNEKFDFNPEDDFAISFYVNPTAKIQPSLAKFGGEGASVDNGEGGSPLSWVDPSKATGPTDSDPAYISTPTAATSSLLELTTFNFSIPSYAFDIKISASILKRSRKLTDVIKDHIIQLRNSGAYIGDNKADTVTNWPVGSYAAALYNPLLTLGFWGASLTPAIVNSSTFGIGIAFDGTSSDTVDVDSVKLTLNYSIYEGNGYIVSKSTTKTIVASPQEGKAAIYNLSNTGSGTVDVFAEPQFPFEIYTTGNLIYFDRFDGTSKPSISSSLSLGINHIHCQKTGSEMEIYVNSAKQASGSDTTVKHTQNKANVYIGTKGNKSDYFSGSLSQIMIYEDAFNQNQINNSYNTVTNTPVIGNIIYPHGIATITKPEYQGILKQHSSSTTTGVLKSAGNAWDPPSYFSGSTWNCNSGIITVNSINYQVVSSSAEKLYIQGNKHISTPTSYSLECFHTASNDYQLKFQASHLIYENELLCTCDENEFNNTNNVTTRKIPTIDNQDLANFATSSLFKPYVTTVGLYNEDNELLLVGKLGQPVRMSDETDTTFLVRYDT